jgi:hypothetical protein
MRIKKRDRLYSLSLFCIQKPKMGVCILKEKQYNYNSFTH